MRWVLRQECFQGDLLFTAQVPFQPCDQVVLHGGRSDQADRRDRPFQCVLHGVVKGVMACRHHGQPIRDLRLIRVQQQVGGEFAFLRCRKPSFQAVQQPGLVVAMVDTLVHRTRSNWPMYAFNAMRPR